MQQPQVLRDGVAVHLVVGAHDRPGLAGGDHALEGGQVDLAQGAFVDLGVDAEPVGLLVVGGVVLDRGAHSAGLDAVDDPDGQLTGQEGVFGEVLEVPPAQRRPFHVDARPQDHRQVARPGLLSQRLTDPVRSRSGFQAEAIADAVGKQVAGSELPTPTWSPNPG